MAGQPPKGPRSAFFFFSFLVLALLRLLLLAFRLGEPDFEPSLPPEALAFGVLGAASPDFCCCGLFSLERPRGVAGLALPPKGAGRFSFEAFLS